MPGSSIHTLSLTELAARIRSRELSPVEVTQAMLERIARIDPELHAYALLLPEAALEAARVAEREIAAGRVRGTLHGVPVAVKDLCALKGVRTACGTRVLSDWKPDSSATVVERLQDAGAVILGKLQLTEGAFGWHHPDVVQPVNPWSAGRWTGVSSSGSGVATAAGLCFGSLGTDTGGSIRFPSACCGLVGLKPSYGRVSRHGVFPLAHSLDHVGPITRTVADAAAMLRVLAGHDPRDASSLRAPVLDYEAELSGGVKGVRIGVDRDYLARGVQRAVVDCAQAALEGFRELGAQIREIEMPPIDALLAGWFACTAVECALAHRATFPSRADEYGPQLRSLLEFGARVSAADYAQIQIERQRFSAALVERFERVDVILCPAMPTRTPTVAEALDGVSPSGENVSNLQTFCAPFDFSGSPTLSLPGGFDDEGLPLGFQLIGRHLDEALLCRAGHAYQLATDWHRRHPPID